MSAGWVPSRISGALFDPSGRLQISNTLRFVDMDPQIAEAQLDIGGTALRFAHGTTVPQRVDWNARDGHLAIRLQVTSVDGHSDTLQFDGPWALFRFFDAGEVASSSSSSTDHRETVYKTNLGSVRIAWESMSTPSPLWSNLLHSFSCPR
jgi:type VI secretion system protein ImpL